MVDETTINSNHDNWVERLRSSGPDREVAIGELRTLLAKGLTFSLGKRFGTSDLIEDFAQDATMKILNSLDSFEGRSQFLTWAMSIATRVGISHMRRKHFQDVSLSAITSGEGLKVELAVDPTASPEELTERASIVRQLGELIDDELTEKQQAVVRALLGGMPVEEIAKKTGSNRNAVYKMIHDARQKLRVGFEDRGINADDISSVFA
jgi:RNA polymerase sigma-70 factor (ECF subfamily)